jgi:excisionase family DNA binding protein
MSEYLTAAEAAKLLGLGKRSILNRIAAGTLPAVQLNGVRRFLIHRDVLAAQIVPVEAAPAPSGEGSQMDARTLMATPYAQRQEALAASVAAAAPAYAADLALSPGQRVLTADHESGEFYDDGN